MQRSPRGPCGKRKSRADTRIINLPTRPRQRDGLVGLTPELSPGELNAATVEQLERTARLRALAGTPDEFLNDLARWVRNGGRPVRCEATATV